MIRSNPIIYIGGPGYSFEYFSPLLLDIENHFKNIISKLTATNKLNQKIKIKFNIDPYNPEKITAFAQRIDFIKNEYKITLSAGLTYHLWLTSRIFLAGHDFVQWIDECQVTKKLELIEKRNALADLTFYLLIYQIILHELAHIFLGHCDYINDVFGILTLDEFSPIDSTKSKLNTQIKAFEAEADRQATEWLLIFYDIALGPNHRGIDLIFPSIKNTYQWLIYSLTAGYVLIQQLSSNFSEKHPTPSQRQYIAILSIINFIKKKNNTEENHFIEDLYATTVEAGNSMGLIGAGSMIELLKSSLDLIFVDEIISKTNIRAYQHNISLCSDNI